MVGPGGKSRVAQIHCTGWRMGRFTLPASSPVSEPDDHNSGTPHAISKLRAVWSNSLSLLVLGECHRFALRIAAILSRSSPRNAIAFPRDPRVPKLPSFLSNLEFARICMNCIREQQSLFPWMGPLETELFAQAFARGFEWSLDNQNNGLHS